MKGATTLVLKAIHKCNGRAGEYWPYGLNIYTGCTFGCRYCCSAAVLRQPKTRAPGYIGLVFDEPEPRKNLLENLERDCHAYVEHFTAINQPTPPIGISPNTDPFQPIEKELGLTRAAIELIHSHGLAVAILTKAAYADVKEILPLLSRDDWFGVTLTTIRNAGARRWEPAAGLPHTRALALHNVYDMGVNTWVSLEPILYPARTIEIIRATHTYVDHYKVGPLNYHPHAKTINWPDACRRIKAVLDELHCDYYLKEDFRAHLDAH